MKNLTPMKADIKLITREPVLILFMLIPILILAVFKLLVLYLLPFLQGVTGLDFAEYNGYILTFVFLLAPAMVGTAAGFLMIDDRDSRIYELMSITPAGHRGYIFDRLLMPFTASIIYTVLGYYIMDIWRLPFLLVLYISVLTGIDGILTSLLLFTLAEDKVQGLACSKALSIFSVLALADLLKTRWVSVLAALCPYYWITRLVCGQAGALTIFAAAAVHFVWLWLAALRVRKV